MEVSGGISGTLVLILSVIRIQDYICLIIAVCRYYVYCAPFTCLSSKRAAKWDPTLLLVSGWWQYLCLPSVHGVHTTSVRSSMDRVNAPFYVTTVGLQNVFHVLCVFCCALHTWLVVVAILHAPWWAGNYSDIIWKREREVKYFTAIDQQLWHQILGKEYRPRNPSEKGESNGRKKGPTLSKQGNEWNDETSRR